MNTYSPMMRIVALLGGIFGVATIVSGGTVLFNPLQITVNAGNYVPFVLWFNFLAGFVYVVAAIGLWLAKPWAVRLSGLIAVATLGISVLFILHILTGGAFENRTVMALIFRTLVWTGIYYFARFNNG